ncbi:MAG: Nif11-like leader peptide family RiPP precursor [Oscillospiraceae bacterium]
MTTKEFIEKMSKDEAVAKKMESCKSPEEAYEAAKEAGLTDDIESFKATMTAINKQLKGELSEEELENISGGKEEQIGVCVLGGIAIGTTVALFTTAAA